MMFEITIKLETLLEFFFRAQMSPQTKSSLLVYCLKSNNYPYLGSVYKSVTYYILVRIHLARRVQGFVFL